MKAYAHPANKGKLVHGDCVELMQSLSDGCIECVVSDPPYGVGYHSNYYKDRNPHAPIANDWNLDMPAFLKECSRVMKDGSALYLFSRWDVSPIWSSYIEEAGLKVKTVIIWVKDNWSAGDLKGSFGNQYEQIIFAVKGRHLLRSKRYPNVWNFPRIPAKRLLHPAQKPIELIERIVTCSSDEGSLVFDPFAGSGSTGEACVNQNRSFLLCEIDQSMVLVTKKRLGFPIEESELPTIKEEKPEPRLFQYPDPSEWGVHPEVLSEIYNELKQNAHSLLEGDA
jgi:site-specific DNA-methyltransferase (adenine-specific)